MSHYSKGRHTPSIPYKLFAENRRRLCASLQDGDVVSNSVVLLEGGDDVYLYDADITYNKDFRQESYFWWTFGVPEAGAFQGLIDVDSGKSILLIPRLPAEYAVWMGVIHGPEHFKAAYEVDEVHYKDEIEDVLKNLGVKNILVLKGQNTDSWSFTSPARFQGQENWKIDETTLHPIINECRVFKTDYELECLRFAGKVSADGHKAAMKATKAGLYEYQLGSIYQAHCDYNGLPMGYSQICGSGKNAAVLHCVFKDAELKDGDLVLLDLGSEYCGYTADITTTFPVNGKFTEKQKLIYNAVLSANQAVHSAAKPGVSWLDMHKLAERKILEALKAGGLLTGEVDEMMEKRLGAVFMPHGLGHFMGINVHDVGGYPPGTARIQEPGLKSLRTTRILKPRMVITIEPGCYFIDPVLDEAYANPQLAKHLVKERIDDYRSFGGVRIEDDIVITETGVENLTVLPRTVEEIEAFMADN